MLLELSDLCFFVKSLKLHESPNQSFNISDHIFFSHNNTRSGTLNKLVQPPIKHNRDKQFYFYRLPHLWNSLPPILSAFKDCLKSYRARRTNGHLACMFVAN